MVRSNQIIPFSFFALFIFKFFFFNDKDEKEQFRLYNLWNVNGSEKMKRQLKLSILEIPSN